MPPSLPTSPWPLIGRTREQIFLREELDAAGRGSGRVILLGGEAGIGKTTLARELVHEADRRGFTCLAGHCYDLSNTPPYGPWLDLAARYPDEPDLPPPPAPFARGRLDQITDQSALFADVWRFFREISARGPALVVLEDLHWADPASLEVIRHIAPRVSTLPLLLIITYRVDEVTELHPFYGQLPALLREANGLQLDLRRLEMSDLRSLVANRYRLAPEDERRLVDYLERHAEGNPFFATELLRALEDEGLLDQSGETSLGGLHQIVLPSLLRQVIEGRVKRLGDEIAKPLAIAAVIGQDVPLDLLARVAGLSDEDLLSLVELAADAHLIEPERTGTSVRFVHALTREALYESVVPPRRRIWHQQVAEALLEQPERDPDAIAFHLTQAGDPRAPDWLIAAGERAQRAYAWLTARERFADAADLLGSSPDDQRQRGWLLYRLARLQRYASSAGALASIDEAVRIGLQTGDELLTIEGRYSRALLRCFAGEFGQGVLEMRESIAALETLMASDRHIGTSQMSWMADALPAVDWQEENQDGPAIEALADRGIHHRRGGLPWFLAASGHVAEAESMAEAFVTAAENAPAMGHWVRSATGHAHIGLAYVSSLRGDMPRAREHFARARRFYVPLDHHAVIAFTYLCELRDVVLVLQADDLAECRRVAEAAAAAVGRSGGTFPPGTSPDIALLRIHYLEGRWSEALAIAGTMPEHGNVYLRREINSTTGQIAHHRGDAARAWAAVETVLPHGPETPLGATLLPEALEIQLLAADLALDVGDIDLARAWLEAGDRWLEWSGAIPGQADNRLAWSRFWAAEGDAERAVASARAGLDLASNPRQPLALIQAHRLLGEYAITGGDLDAARPHLQTSLDLARACATPRDVAFTLTRMARLADLEDRHEEAASASAEAVAIFAELGVPSGLVEDLLPPANDEVATPERPEYPAGLTHREIEVLRLVAKGMTDSAVAEELFISPPLHLQQVGGLLPHGGQSLRYRPEPRLRQIVDASPPRQDAGVPGLALIRTPSFLLDSPAQNYASPVLVASRDRQSNCAESSMAAPSRHPTI